MARAKPCALLAPLALRYAHRVGKTPASVPLRRPLTAYGGSSHSFTYPYTAHGLACATSSFGLVLATARFRPYLGLVCSVLPHVLNVLRRLVRVLRPRHRLRGVLAPPSPGGRSLGSGAPGAPSSPSPLPSVAPRDGARGFGRAVLPLVALFYRLRAACTKRGLCLLRIHNVVG